MKKIFERTDSSSIATLTNALWCCEIYCTMSEKDGKWLMSADVRGCDVIYCIRDRTSRFESRENAEKAGIDAIKSFARTGIARLQNLLDDLE